MERKKIIAVISLIVLIGGVVGLAMWIKNKPTKEQKAFADKFTRDMQEAKKETITGIVTASDGQNLTVRVGKESVNIKINKDTSVLLADKEKKLTNGQMTDLKVGSVVKLDYDKATRTASIITLANFD